MSASCPLLCPLLCLLVSPPVAEEILEKGRLGVGKGGELFRGEIEVSPFVNSTSFAPNPPTVLQTYTYVHSFRFVSAFSIFSPLNLGFH